MNFLEDLLENFYFRNYVNATIGKAFYTYNGKINTFNPAKLVISWTSCSGILGKYTFPDKVTIYPIEILKVITHLKNFELLEIIIVTTIIHELHHADQMFHPYLNLIDNEYSKYFVEMPVNGMMCIYTKLHQLEICRDFNIEKYAFDYIMNHYPETEYYSAANRYKRRDIYSHIMMILENMIQDEEVIKHINYWVNEIYKQPNTTIIININNDDLIVKAGNIYASVIQINNFFSKIGYVFQFDTIEQKCPNELVYLLSFTGKTYNLLVR